jgi:hypothetical protein
VVPLLLGEGMRLTPRVSPEAELTLEGERALPEGAVEIVTPAPERSRPGPGRRAAGERSQ